MIIRYEFGNKYVRRNKNHNEEKVKKYLKKNCDIIPKQIHTRNNSEKQIDLKITDTIVDTKFTDKSSEEIVVGESTTESHTDSVDKNIIILKIDLSMGDNKGMDNTTDIDTLLNMSQMGDPNEKFTEYHKSTNIEHINLDCRTLRQNRQKKNKEIVYNSIKNNI